MQYLFNSKRVARGFSLFGCFCVMVYVEGKVPFPTEPSSELQSLTSQDVPINYVSNFTTRQRSAVGSARPNGEPLYLGSQDDLTADDALPVTQKLLADASTRNFVQTTVPEATPVTPENLTSTIQQDQPLVTTTAQPFQETTYITNTEGIQRTLFSEINTQGFENISITTYQTDALLQNTTLPPISNASSPPTPPPRHICRDDHVCIRKCCPSGTLLDFDNGSPDNDFCSDVSLYNTTGWEPNLQVAGNKNIEIVTETLARIENIECGVYEAKEFLLQEDGNINYYETGQTLTYTFYCIDKKVENGKVTVGAALCMKPVVKSQFSKVADYLHMVALGISTFFLLLILLVHFFLTTRKDLQQKLVASGCLNLLFGFALVIVNMSPAVYNIDEDKCVALAISTQFFFLAFYFWLNVMCYEISRIIRGTMKLNSIRDLTKSERRYFVYCGYAWGFPLLVCSVTISMQYLPEDLPEDVEQYIVRPRIADGRCWFKDDGAAIYAYYYCIEVFLHIINAVLMGHTEYLIHKEKLACLCCKIKNGFSTPLRTHRSKDYLKMFKQQLTIYMMYLFIWIMNSVSLIKRYKDFWRIVDLIIALQGVYLFFIVVRPRKDQILAQAYEKVSDISKRISFKSASRKFKINTDFSAPSDETSL